MRRQDGQHGSFYRTLGAELNENITVLGRGCAGRMNCMDPSTVLWVPNENINVLGVESVDKINWMDPSTIAYKLDV